MRIKITNPDFLRETLENEVVNRVRHLVEQRIAYDANWRDGFVNLFEILDQLEQPLGEKLDPQPPADVDPEFKYEWTGLLNAAESIVQPFRVGTPVTIGDSTLEWVVEGVDDDRISLAHPTDSGRIRHTTVHVSRLNNI